MKNKEFYVAPETEVIEITTMEATVTSPVTPTTEEYTDGGEGQWDPIDGNN